MRSERARRPGVALAGAIAAAAVAASCSLTTTDVQECGDSRACQRRFGPGFVCTDDGLCRESEPLARCESTYPDDLFDNRAAHRDRIVIGNLMDRSLATHRARERSARLAFQQANAEGGLEGRSFGVVFCTIEESDEFDGLSRTDAAIASARFLADEVGVPAIVGPAASSDTQATFLAVQDDGVLMISPSATSPALSRLDPAAVTDEQPGLLWRTAPPDSLQGTAIAEDMLEPGAGRAAPVSSVAGIYQAGAYGEGLYTEFAEAFTAGGGATTPYPYDDANQRDAAIGAIASESYDEVLFVSSQAADVIAFLDATAPLSGYDDKTLFLTDAAANADVFAGADPARFTQVRGSRPAPRDEDEDLVYAAFLAGYSAEYGEDARPYSFTAQAYDAAWLVTYGAAWALLQEGEITGTNIARGLRRLSAGEAVEIRPTNWNTVLQAFRAGASVNVAGASGALDYGPATEETSSNIEIWEIQGGDAAAVDTWSPP